jgi:hypothetical protein
MSLCVGWVGRWTLGKGEAGVVELLDPPARQLLDRRRVPVVTGETVV